MRFIIRVALLAFLVLPAMYAVAQSAAAPSPQAPQQKVDHHNETAANDAAKGEKLFHDNCGRCHNPPEDLSPREARAVIRKMRVRAMLSAEDEKLILEYIAP